MFEIIRKHHISFKNAWSGIIWALKTQPNFRIHITLSLIAIGMGLYYRISQTEFLVIVFTIILGLSAEMINTSLEAMTDLITTEWRKNAKIAKDVAAGMMLSVAIGAVVVWFIIFSPYLF